jgi:hypothetical protein
VIQQATPAQKQPVHPLPLWAQQTPQAQAQHSIACHPGSCYTLRASPAAVADGVVKPPPLKAKVGVQPRQPRCQAFTHLQQQRKQQTPTFYNTDPNVSTALLRETALRSYK